MDIGDSDYEKMEEQQEECDESKYDRNWKKWED